jgi:hypothetical protein
MLLTTAAVAFACGSETISPSDTGRGGSDGSGGHVATAGGSNAAAGGSNAAAGGSNAAAGGSNAAAGGSNAAGGSAGSTGAVGDDVRQLCVDLINQYRATLGLVPYERWTSAETCVDGEAQADSQTATAHSAFGTCKESAQDECPGWSGTLSDVITKCLKMMWAEGPGGGHYDNMSSNRKRAACGFYVLPNGKVWAAQDFQWPVRARRARSCGEMRRAVPHVLREDAMELGVAEA